MLKQTNVQTKLYWIFCVGLLLSCLLLMPAPVYAEESEVCGTSELAIQEESSSDTGESCLEEATESTEEPAVVVGVPIIKDNTGDPTDLPEKFTPDRSENTGDYSMSVPDGQPAPVVTPAVNSAENTPKPPVRKRRAVRRPAPTNPNNVQAVAAATTAKPNSTSAAPMRVTFGRKFAAVAGVAAPTVRTYSKNRMVGEALLLVAVCAAAGILYPHRPKRPRHH